MFKSFFDWLISSNPVANWILIILLFGCAVSTAELVGVLMRKREERI